MGDLEPIGNIIAESELIKMFMEGTNEVLVHHNSKTDMIDLYFSKEPTKRFDELLANNNFNKVNEKTYKAKYTKDNMKFAEFMKDGTI